MRNQFTPKSLLHRAKNAGRDHANTRGKIQIRNVARHSSVWGASTAPDDVHFLISGRLSVQHRIASGQWRMYYQLDALPWGATIPLILTDEYPDPTRCIALTDAVVLTVRGLDLNAVLASSQTFRAFVFQAYAQRVRHLIDQIAPLPLHSEFRRVGRNPRQKGSHTRAASTLRQTRSKNRCN